MSTNALHAVDASGYDSRPSTVAVDELLSDDKRFKLRTICDIDGVVHAALVMIERGALTEKKAREHLTERERVVFDRALEIANAEQPAHWTQT